MKTANRPYRQLSIADSYAIAQKLCLTPREILRWAHDLELDREGVRGFISRYPHTKLRIMIQHHEPTMAQLPDAGKDHTNNLMKRLLGGL